MTSLASLVSGYTRTPSATCYLDGKRWYGIQKLRYSQRFGENIAGGGAEGRAPPTTPRIGMAISWRWGYNGYEVAGCTGEVSDIVDQSYPDRWQLQVKDVLWRADKSSQVIQTDPLNDITAKAAITYILTHYGGLSASRLQIPTLSASGSAWVGSAWVLGTLTPVAWGDLENDTGGTTALKAAQEICSCLGYWLYATADGKVTAKLLERKPSTTAREVFQRNVNLLLQGAPERRQNYDSIYNQVTVLGGNTGVEGSQIRDQFRDTHPLLQPNVYRDFPFSSFLIEYVNEVEAGAASATAIAKRIHKVVSRIPDVIPLRAKADPNRKVGDTAGLIDIGVSIATQRNFFIYGIDRELDLASGRFDDQIVLDGGTGSTGYTTIPPPDASFSWRLMAETLDGVSVVEVFLDGSASTSPTGEIVSFAWSTSTPTYGATPNTATGEQAVLIFAAANSPAVITLTVTDTSSKIGTFEANVDLTGADTREPIQEVISAAAGAAWLITPDGGAIWREETTNGDAIAVGIVGGGADDRSLGTGGTYGLVSTRGAGGAGGIRRTLDTLLTPSTNLVSNSATITSNIWVNESNPARVWFAIGDTPYRSTDGGVTKVAMAKPAVGVNITWIMEDPALDDSVFCLAGPDMYNATNPASGWALLYEGPVGAIARQFVRSRDGQITWICYTGAPAGEALQRVENGAAADVAATGVRTLALDRDASNLRATLYAITGDSPAQIWSFDGLTGLSAVQSGETFPVGATVQHMLPSRVADVIYTADFDSIAAGRGALRKYFPQADQLLLWKTLDPGQQGHMLGLGGRGTAMTATIILLPYAASGAADKIWFLDAASGVWTGKTPPEASKMWYSIRANPFDPRKLLLFRRPKDSDGVTGGNALWYSADFGDTWTNIWTDIANGTNFNWRQTFVEWSPTFGVEWISSRIVSGSGYLIRGNLTSYTEHLIGTDLENSAMPGLQGDAFYEGFDGSTGITGYIDSSNTAHPTTGNVPGGWGNTLHGTRKAATVSPLSSTIQISADYQVGGWAAVNATVYRHSFAVLADGTIIVGNGTNIDTIADAWGAATVTQTSFGIADAMTAASSDAQSQTIAAVLRNGANDGGSAIAQPVVRDPVSSAWSLVPRPPGAGNLANAIEVVTTTT